MSTALSPTTRTTIHRHGERGSTDRGELVAILREALVCHLGILRDGVPVVLPTIHAVDPEGPDEGGTLYLHGSVAAPWLREAPEQTVCATFTLVDGAVLARSGFNHSLNYRSAVVFGRARRVDDEAERDRALWLIVDHVVPGRSATLRPFTRKELAATALVAVPLAEASVKARTGGPNDEPGDVDAGVWAGVVPLGVRASAPVPDAETRPGLAVPDDVRRRLAEWGVPDQD